MSSLMLAYGQDCDMPVLVDCGGYNEPLVFDVALRATGVMPEDKGTPLLFRAIQGFHTGKVSTTENEGAVFHTVSVGWDLAAYGLDNEGFSNPRGQITLSTPDDVGVKAASLIAPDPEEGDDLGGAFLQSVIATLRRGGLIVVGHDFIDLSVVAERGGAPTRAHRFVFLRLDILEGLDDEV